MTDDLEIEEEATEPYVWFLPRRCPHCRARFTRPEAVVVGYSYGGPYGGVRPDPDESLESVGYDGRLTDSTGHIASGDVLGVECMVCHGEIEAIRVDGPKDY